MSENLDRIATLGFSYLSILWYNKGNICAERVSYVRIYYWSSYRRYAGLCRS